MAYRLKLLKILADEGDSDTLVTFVISSSLCGWKGACRNNGKMQSSRCFARTKVGRSEETIVAFTPWHTPAMCY